MKKFSVFLVNTFKLVSNNSFSQTKQDALVLYNNGKFREAILVCEAELQENPNRIESYVVMCWSLVKNKQYNESIHITYHYGAAIAIPPSGGHARPFGRGLHHPLHRPLP